MLAYAWRFNYQIAIMTPLLGYQLHRRGSLIPRAFFAAATQRDAWYDATLHSFTEKLTEPARARAAVQMYRTFQLRELWPVIRGH